MGACRNRDAVGFESLAIGFNVVALGPNRIDTPGPAPLCKVLDFAVVGLEAVASPLATSISRKRAKA